MSFKVKFKPSKPVKAAIKRPVSDERRSRVGELKVWSSIEVPTHVKPCK